MAAEDVPARVGSAARKRIRSEAGRARTTIITASSSNNGLSPEAARRASAELGVLGVIRMFAQDRQVKKLEEKATPSSALRPTEAVLRQFGLYKRPRGPADARS